jgi:allantoin racemase
MRLLIINPNTTVSMTTKIGAAARAAAHVDTQIIATNPASGPASIEGFYDEAFSVPGLLEEAAKGEAMGVDGHIIACFDDTGLEAARCLARAPVIGIGEAAFHMAALVAHRFSVITTLNRSIAAIETNLLKYGLDRRCARVRAAEVPVLSLEDPASDARARIDSEIASALREDNSDAIVLGCAGMADLARDLATHHSVPVLDGVACAVKLAEGLAALSIRTSKTGAYATPGAKSYRGLFASMAPRD